MDAVQRYTLFRPDRALAERGLRVLVGGPESAPHIPLRGRFSDIDQRVAGFLAYAQSVNLDITRQILVMEPGAAGGGGDPESQRIVSMCLWVPSPGKTAMLFGPGTSESPEIAPATIRAVEAAMIDVRAAGMTLVQAMLEPADAAGKTVFAAAGLTQLATLTYMERKPPAFAHLSSPARAVDLPAGYSLEPYTAANHALFCEAILNSYEQTLDCPALSGIREIEDIVAGHKAVGPFDPQLWSLLLRYGKPVGCLLLSEIPARNALELVYLGLALDARGQGLGRLLMQRLLTIATRRQYELATLAVDAANVPAAALYRRCGFTSVAQRVAMVRRLA